MLNETEFHRLADNTLETLSDTLEAADETGLLTVEYEGSIITIELQDSRQFILSKHTPTRQLWLSSPLSGGLHFDYDEAHRDWRLADNRNLRTLLFGELKQLAGWH